MLLTMLCLSFVVFFFVNLEPNLQKLAIIQTEMRATDQHLENWLQRNGYRDNFFVRYGRWIGVAPKQPIIDPKTGQAGAALPFCDEPAEAALLGRAAGRFRLLDRVPHDGRRQSVAGARRDRHADVLGDGRRWCRWRCWSACWPACAKGRDSTDAVGRLDRLDRDAGICVRRHLLRDLCLVARLAQRLGRHRDRRRASPSTISRCR